MILIGYTWRCPRARHVIFLIGKENNTSKTSLRLYVAVALELAAEQAGIELAEVKNVDLNLIPDEFYCVTYHGTCAEPSPVSPLEQWEEGYYS